MRECLGGIYEFLEKKKLASLRELELSKSPGGGSDGADKGAGSAAKGAAPAKPTETAAATSKPKLSYAEQRERDKMLRKAAKKVEEEEAKIASIEGEIAEIEAKIASGVVDNDIFTLHQSKNKELENAMSLWELASAELDEMKERFGR